MAEQLKIVIDADVSKAVNGLDRLNAEFSETVSNADRLAKTISNPLTVKVSSQGLEQLTNIKPVSVSVVPKFEPTKFDVKPIPVSVVPTFENGVIPTFKPIEVPVIPEFTSVDTPNLKPLIVQVIQKVEPIPAQVAKPVLLPVIPKVEPIPTQAAKPILLPVIPDVKPIPQQQAKPVLFPVIPDVKPIPTQQVKPIVYPVIPDVKTVQLPSLKPVRVDVNLGRSNEEIKKFDLSIGILTRQLERLQRIAANTSLGFKDQQRVSNLIQKTTSDLNKMASASAAAAPAMSKLNRSSSDSIQVLTNLSRVAQDAPFGFIGIANNINPLIESFQRLQAASKATGTSLRANLLSALTGPAGIGLALGITSSLLISFGDDLLKLLNPSQELSDALKSAAENMDKNAASVVAMASALKSGSLSASETKRVQKELIDQAPEFQSAFDGNKVNVEKLDEILAKKYIPRLINTIKSTAALEIVNKKLAASMRQVAEGGTISFVEALRSFNIFDAISGDFSKTAENAGKTATKNFNKAFEDLKPENITKLIEETFKSLGLTFSDFSGTIDDGKKSVGKSIEQLQNELISKARLFAKEFGNAFVVPNLEESFFNTRNKIFKASKDLLTSVDKFIKGDVGALQIKLPVQPEIELLPVKEFEVPQNIIDNFLKGIKIERSVPVEITPDITLSKGSLDKIDEKLDLRKRFETFGDFGLKEFNKIFEDIDTADFSQLTKGIEEATNVFQGMLAIATTLQQTLSQGVTNAFNSVFDAILDGKNVFKALGDAVKELIAGTIKAIAQMLILKAITSIIFPGGGVAGSLIGRAGAIGGSANLFGLGNQIGSRAFSNTLNIVVTGELSGQNILLAGQRAGNSNVRFG